MKALKILKKVLIYFPKCPKSMNYIPPRPHGFLEEYIPLCITSKGLRVVQNIKLVLTFSEPAPY